MFYSSGRAGGIIVSEEPITKNAERSAKNRGTFCVFVFYQEPEIFSPAMPVMMSSTQITWVTLMVS